MASCCASFSPKYALSGVDDVQQFRNHRAHAAEMPRAFCAAERVGQFENIHIRHVGRWVHLANRWREHRVRARVFAGGKIALWVARIGIKILARAKLRRVDKNADHDLVALLAGPALSG